MAKSQRVSMETTEFVQSLVQMGEQARESEQNVYQIALNIALSANVRKNGAKKSAKTDTKKTTRTWHNLAVNAESEWENVEAIDNGETITLKHPEANSKTFTKEVAQTAYEAIVQNDCKYDKKTGKPYCIADGTFVPSAYLTFAGHLLGLTEEQLAKFNEIRAEE